METQKITAIDYAVTLTTGDDANPMLIKCKMNQLNNILINYKKYFKFTFNLEILDKQLMETKIHFHGHINCPLMNIQYFHRFIREWKVKYFVMVKLVTHLPDWIKYIEKQEYIYRIGYPDLSYKINNITCVKHSNLLNKYRIK